MKYHKLYVHYESQLVGILEEEESGLLRFTYESAWILYSEAFPLSLALSLNGKTYTGKVVTSFFENLIPEGEQRRRIEQFAQLPAADDAAFLERFGEDCAGALAISIHPQRHILKSPDSKRQLSFSIEKAIEMGVPVATFLEKDGELSPFSLAGAQAKIPCCIEDRQIFWPRSGAPTTHIIKFPIRSGQKLLDSVENEYLSMRLAEKCGMNVPRVTLLGENIPLFAIERFDRKIGSTGVHRIHTQDFCQALGRPSKEKYERHGGPSFADCYALLREHSSQVATDLLSILDWIGFNLAIGNNDSHAKNLSLMLTDSGIRLAPFYDLICTALYPQYNAQFAFRIAEALSWDKVSADRIDTFAKKFGLRGGFIGSRWKALFERISQGMQELADEVSAQKNLTRTLRKMRQEQEKRVATLARSLKP